MSRHVRKELTRFVPTTTLQCFYKYRCVCVFIYKNILKGQLDCNEIFKKKFFFFSYLSCCARKYFMHTELSGHTSIILKVVLCMCVENLYYICAVEICEMRKVIPCSACTTISTPKTLFNLQRYDNFFSLLYLFFFFFPDNVSTNRFLFP